MAGEPGRRWVVCDLARWDILFSSGAYDAGTLNATWCFAERADRAPLSVSRQRAPSPRFEAREAPMKIALVAQNATPLHPRTGSGPDHDDVGLNELTRKLAGQGHQVTVYTEKNLPGLPDQAELHQGVRVEHINAGPVPETAGEPGDADLLERVPAFSGP